MVLHRPVEPARLTRSWYPIQNSIDANVGKTFYLPRVEPFYKKEYLTIGEPSSLIGWPVCPVSRADQSTSGSSARRWPSTSPDSKTLASPSCGYSPRLWSVWIVALLNL